MKCYADKIDDATHAVLNALGLRAEDCTYLADKLNDAIDSLVREYVTGDDEPEED